MKTINLLKYQVAVAIIILLASCEDFLDKTSKTDHWGDAVTIVPTESKYATPEEAVAELNGAYNGFRNDVYQFELFFYNDAQSDNCYEGGDGVPEAEVENLKVNSLNSKTEMMWEQLYAMAGNATSVIENTRMMKPGAIDETERTRIMAEGKFIRSWVYFDIIRIWGDAPFNIKLLPAVTAGAIDTIYHLYYPSRTPIDKIYDGIIRDLEDAIPSLSGRSQGYRFGSKGAAYGLLAKIYATKGEKSGRNYQKVVDYCNLVIAEGYSLMNSYEELWDPYSNNETRESIFEVDYTLNRGNWAFWVLFSEEDGSITWRRYCTPTHEVISKYTTDDRRFNSTITYKTVPYDTYFPSNNYPIANKIRTKEANIILMRLADIILLKAEALVELGNVSEAIELVNNIRNRAGLDNIANNMSKEEARLVVENERQLELMLEGHRWFDLNRNDRMIEVMTKHRGKNGQILFPTISEHRKLWPIPQNEKDQNPNLTQNQGY